MSSDKVYQMKFSNIYPCLVNKAQRKGRSKEEVDEIICWLTGYSRQEVEEMSEGELTYGDFFKQAPQLNDKRHLIKGTVCGVKVEEIEDTFMREVRYLDKLIDELAKGKAMDSILKNSRISE